MGKIIAIDFDGVISNPYGIKLKILKKMGYDVSMDQITYGGCVKSGIVSEADYKYANKMALNAGPHLVYLEQDFLFYYKKLLKLPYKYFIVSSRNDIDMKVLQSIIQHYDIKFDGIINTNNKNKYFSLLDINASILIEDNSFFIEEIINELKKNKKNKIKIVYYKNSVNSNEELNSKYIKSLQGWKNVYQYLINSASENE